MNYNNSFTTLDFLISLSASLGVCNAKPWLDYYNSLDEYRKFDICCFFRYLTLGATMEINQPYKLKKNNQMARAITVITPNNAKLKITIEEFPGFDLLEQRLLLCKVNVDVLELNKLALVEIQKLSDQQTSDN